MAQPVRSRDGWLLACQPPSNEHQLTLLVDFAASDQRPDWDLMPDGQQRTLLMLDSPRLVRLHFDLRTTEHRTLKLGPMDCVITATHARSHATSAREGSYYEITIACRDRTEELPGHSK